ncbi:MAG: TetR/AcrR family transcriptional regulator [Lachnospiraceae bacterium]|nr:TetR/AcrR family transcriptional regulator [Lachnospiraceae bacterium]
MKNKGSKRKNELLKIAYELFLSQGYENTSVDEIIEKAGIAKGTYYYYFQSKEQMLEEVIDMMIEAQKEQAEKIMESDLPIPQKIVGIIASYRPKSDESPILETLNKPENVLFHDKVNKKLQSNVIPLLAKVTEDGIEEGIFQCSNVEERIRILIVISQELFDDDQFTPAELDVFIDVAEKILGAKEGTLAFIRQLFQ